MKKILLGFITLFFLVFNTNSANAQGVGFDPNDPNWVFTGTNNPAQPAWNNYNIVKWGHTNRLSWNPYSLGYKAYYHQGMVFRVKFPTSYQHNVADGKKYPIFIFFHGLGERASIYDNEYQLLHGGLLHAQKVNDGTYDGFLVYPQSTSGAFSGYFPAINAFIDSLVASAKGDADRLLVSGLSGGSQANFEYINLFPQRVASLLPISAAKTDYYSQLVNYLTVPIWITNGGLDNNPAPGIVNVLIDSFRRQGGLIKQTLWPTQGHGVWNSFWGLADYFPYLSLQHKANPLVYFQRSEFCSNQPVAARLALQPGFFAYEWEKDGTTIAGANANEYITNDYGSYRGRFKRTSTSAWSAWSPIPVIVTIKQATVTPPISIDGMYSNVLPSPDGRTTVPLMVPKNYADYEWRRISDNALVSDTNFYNAPVGQYKVKVNELFGCSSDFSAVFPVIAANGTNLPDKASNLNALTLSNAAIQLDWSENPTPPFNETAFEIFRSTKSGSGYVMAGKVPADELTFIDETVSANTRYYYIVRAVNDNGASAISNEANAKTLGDNTAPTVPLNLRLTASTNSTISIAWDPSSDDVGVFKYDIYVNGVKSYITGNTFTTIANLNTNQSYAFYVTARDESGNVSAGSNQLIGIAKPSAITYKYYEGTYSVLPNFNNLTPVKTGVVSNVTILPRNRDDNFAFMWDGYINIPVTATYQFETYSDDGSKLYIDTEYSSGATAVVNNDGLHGSQYASGTINLTAGVHRFIATFFEQGGGQEMKVFWRSVTAGIPVRTEIPDSAFRQVIVPVPANLPAVPSNLMATAVSTSKINLTWTDNSTNETGFQLFRSSSLAGPYLPIGTVGANITSYGDSVGLTGGIKYWYKIRSLNVYGESALVSNYDAAWNFNNNYNDESGNNRTLNGLNLPDFSNTDKKEGTHAVSLNGVNQAVNVPNSSLDGFPANNYTTRTVGLWVKPFSASLGGNNKILVDFGGSANGLAIRFNGTALQAAIASNSTRRTLSVSSITSNAAWVTGGWNHIGLVYNVNALTLYLNGVSVGTTTLTTSSVFSTTDASRFGASSGTNAFNTSATSSYFKGMIDNVVAVKEALSAAQMSSFMKYALQADTTVSLPAIPAAPSNLVSNTQTTTSVSLTFDDNSTNESGFEIYRSVATNGNFRYLTTIPANGTAVVNYTDKDLFANTDYFYMVRSVNAGGVSAFTAQLAATTLNNIPVFETLPAPNFYMSYGTTASLNIKAIDTDGEAMSFNLLTSLPAFASFSNTGNGTGTFDFTNPTIAEQGTYPVEIEVADGNNGKDTLQFDLVVNDNNRPVPATVTDRTVAEGATLNVPVSATDAEGNASLVWSLVSAPSFVSITNGTNGAGTIVMTPGFSFAGVHTVTAKVTDAGGAYATISFNVTVTNAEPVSQTIYMSIEGGGTASPAPWNNIINVVSNNLADTAGTVTTVGLDFSTGWFSTGTAGAVTGNNSGVYPDEVMRDYFFCGAFGSPDTITITLRGLTVGARYNVNLFGSSSWTYYADNGTTIYEYNGIRKNLYVQDNTQQTVSFSSITPNATGNIILRIFKAAGSPYGALNAIVLQKLINDGSAPAMPTNFTGEALDNAVVSLSWKDNSYNENNFLVYRATNPAGPYTLLNPGATNANDSTYTDYSTASQTTYYYKIEAVNVNGSSGQTEAVQVTASNRLPVITPVSETFVKAGTTATVNVISTDPGDVLTVTVTGLPSFASFAPTGNGNGTITITPGANDVGAYNNITITVTDNNGGMVTETFDIIVTDAAVRNVYVNFGGQSSTPEAAPWNNILTYPFANYTVTNLRDDANTTTPFGVKIVEAWADNQLFGMVTGYNNGIYPDNVMQSSFTTQDNTVKNVQITGLNTAKRYNVVLFSSHDAGISSLATMTIGATSTTLDGMYNSVKSSQINNITPNASGIINVALSKTSAINYLNLNALVIQEYDPSFITSSIMRPYNLMAETLLDSSKIKLTWSDQSSNELGFQLYRSTSQYGTYSLITTTGANVTTYTDAGLSPNLRYFYKIRSYRGSAPQIFSNYSNIATTILSPRIVYINLNVETAMNAASPWNNTNSPSSAGITFPSLKDNRLFNSGIEMEITKEFNGTGYAGVNSSTGVFPSVVMQSNYWSDANQLSEVRFNNLNINKRYRIGLFGSAIFFGYAIANYTVNGKTVQLNSYNNSTKVVYLDELKPNSSGELVLSVVTAPGQPYTFNGAITIESYDPNDNYTPINTNRENPGTEDAIIIPGTIDNGRQAVPFAGNSIQQQKPVPAAKPAEGGNTVNVYPNPFTDRIEVELSAVEAKVVSIMLYDGNGRLIYKSPAIKQLSGKNIIHVNLPGGISVAPGTYILNVLFDGKPGKTVKLVKIN